MAPSADGLCHQREGQQWSGREGGRYGGWSVSLCVKVELVLFFVPEIPSHDFCCAYLERHDVIFLQIIRDPFYKIFRNTGY